MYKISKIVSKQVVSLCGAKVLGTVVDVKFSPSLKRAEYLLLMDCEENDDAYLKLPMKSVHSLGEDAVVVKTLASPLSVERESSNSPINRPCYNQDGKSLGRISDVELNENYSTYAFSAGGVSYAADTLLSFSPSLVIINDSGTPIKLPRPKARPPRQADKDLPVFTANCENRPVGTTYLPCSDMNTEITLPTKLCSPPPDLGTPDFSFLLGKRISRALYSADGELIAAQDSVITQSTIASARKDNKLVQLTLRAY